ncbi:hypothetical protein V2H45_17515 [Tumidithrix elongata RA019]|uniref:Uncharacterized protein n=1 Tax=Tumidithrix elongata BACA0141 TaxID=2716417 RepID=A0AAW9Q061_9CYAN|nr:hypothetical protein [Tumidithrix elongata RA019]
MREEFSDPYLAEILDEYNDTEVTELLKYLDEWDAGTYSSVAQSILDHAKRKGFTVLRYLRKAHNFSKKGSMRVPRSGYRQDGSAIYRKGTEFLIVRLDQYGLEKIVTYGINEE